MVVEQGQQYNTGEKPTVSYTVRLHKLQCKDAPKQRQETLRAAWIQLNFVTLGLGSDGCQHHNISILLRAFSELLICMLHQFGLGCIKNGAL